MTYLPKAQEQMNGDLLVPETTKLFLHRLVQDLQAQLERDPATRPVEPAALQALQSALGPCYEPLPTVHEMLDLPDPDVERRAANLLRVHPAR